MSLGELRAQSGLIGLWHLNGNSTDSSGNSNNGTDTSITYSQANGKFGQGAGLNGSTSKIDLGTGSSLNITQAGSITINAWINPSAISSLHFIISKDGGTGTTIQYRMFLDSLGRLIGSLGSGDVVSTATLSTGNWYMVTLVGTGGSSYLYINGKADGTASSALNTTTVSTIIGARASEYYFNGKIDEVAIFNVAKSADWVRKNYAIGRFGEL